MVATQADGALSHHTNRKLIDHMLRIGAAIDVIAEVDFLRVSDGPAPEIVVDAFGDFIQQIRTAMDVADRVDTRVWRR
jgi:hypothetical protein